jgi:phosphatidylglycerophosphatase A
MNPSSANIRTFITRFRQASLAKKGVLGLACWFGFGLIPRASGTLGTMAALPLVFLFAHAGPWPALILVTAALLLAIWIADQAQKVLAQDDPGVIVIDEVAGLLVSLLWIPLSFFNVLSGLLFFRFFDIVKPYPIKRIENLPGGFGIVLDDVLAGIYANVTLRLMILALNQI